METVAAGGKGEGHPIPRYERPEEEQRYSFTLSLTSGLHGVGGQHHDRPLYPQERDPVSIVQGPRPGLDRCGEFRVLSDSIPTPSSP